MSKNRASVHSRGCRRGFNFPNFARREKRAAQAIANRTGSKLEMASKTVLTAQRIYQDLAAEGFAGAYDSVKKRLSSRRLFPDTSQAGAPDGMSAG